MNLGQTWVQALRQAMRRKPQRTSLHDVISKNPDGILIVDPGGAVLYCNLAAEVLFWRKAEELKGKIFGLPLVADKTTEVELLISGGGVRTVEMYVVETEWEGQSAFLASLHDITERKHIEKNLALFSSLIAHMPAGVLVENEKREILSVNEEFCSIFSIIKPREELIGDDWSDIAKQCLPRLADAKAFPRRVDEIVKAQKVVTNEEIEFADGRCFERDYSPIFTRNDEFVGHMWQYRDITERKFAMKKIEFQKNELDKANRELKKKNDELERLSQVKSTFVSKVSHELRTPLTVIMSSSNNLLDGAYGALSEPQKKWVGRIFHHAIRLQEMLSDILDLSKLESGTADMRCEQLNIEKLIKTLVVNMQMLTGARKQSLTCEVPEGLPALWAYPGRIEQILTNLITNAMKYTQEGGAISVSAHMADGDNLQVTIADNGPGIAPEHHKAIFERFTQIHREGDDKIPMKGIGLGLAICKEIVAQHRGRIWVESEPGKGSRFIFQIPVDLRTFRPLSNHILVVDDEEDICDLLKMTLTRKGYQVSVSQNGKEAIELISNKDNPYDLIFLDLMLPGTSGLDVIKSTRKVRPEIPIIIITAYPNSDILFKSMEHAPLTFIAKPFKLDHILETMKRFLPKEPSAAPPEERKTA
ncbi:MAG: hypothetical protein A3G41_00040 [Elusimicrobia bacterium RIFCSPLOWO2_12_FULL_59_9]|nr:MAG: hypothetical protein A3G41_00040 [Elusimicrobia bacterium RIFCSPLOWO2_12_FULL_59_9]